MRRFLLTLATAASALAVTSCGDITGTRGDVAGTYELQTVDGDFLPATISDPDFGSVTFEYGELQLDSDGTFVDVVQYRIAGSSRIETDEIFGTWSISGDRIRFEPDDVGASSYTMERRSGDRLVQSNGGVQLVYERF
jgi:hypothetical protein